jgi:MFS family permease
LRLKTASEPLIPAEVLANPVVAKGTIAACFGMGVFIGLTIYTPIYLETVHGLTASQSGLALIPLMAGTVLGASFSGRFMARVRHYKRIPVIGLIVAIGALGILTVEPRGFSLFVLEALLCLTSIGLGTLLPVTMVAMQNAVMPHQMGTATGAMNFFRSLGGALIVAVFGAILFSGLPESVLARTTIETLASDIAQSGADVASVFRWVFAAAALGLALALGCIALMEERPLKSRVG